MANLRAHLSAPQLKRLAIQTAMVGLLGYAALWLSLNTIYNLEDRGITVGFDFLARAAHFPIAESVLAYRPSDSFAWAFVVGLGNTLFIAAIACVGATLLGYFLARLRLARNPLLSGVAAGLVDALRNTPVVVQLLFWYALVTLSLPDVKDAARPLTGVLLTNRGIFLPVLTAQGLSLPEIAGARIVGGLRISPEFAAICAGLIVYSAAFVGEIIRGGVNAVPLGQWEAARALGLGRGRTLRQIILPQALRIIVPPMTSQYVNIIKNTTLALVVGYPDLSFVTATTINQTGQAVEGVVILMLTFLAISLIAAGLMGILNRRLNVRPA